MNLIILPEAHSNLRLIASKNEFLARSEVARVYALLEDIDCKLRKTARAHWDNAKEGDGRIRSCSTLKGGTPIWRLYPEHIHCIAILVEVNKDIHVLDFCSQADLSATEIRLIDNH